jgi:hypothetical protein
LRIFRETKNKAIATMLPTIRGKYFRAFSI